MIKKIITLCEINAKKINSNITMEKKMWYDYDEMCVWVCIEKKSLSNCYFFNWKYFLKKSVNIKVFAASKSKIFLYGC